MKKLRCLASQLLKQTDRRKVRLCVVAIARCLQTTYQPYIEAIEIAEKFADDEQRITTQDLNDAWTKVYKSIPKPINCLHNRIFRGLLNTRTNHAVNIVISLAPNVKGFKNNQERIQNLYDCIFTNEEIPSLVINENVLNIANSIYEERRWQEMSILGDALEEAGLTNQLILDHCRTHPLHARGCFVVDKLRGK